MTAEWLGDACICAVRLLVENYMKRCVILGTTIRVERVSSEVIILRPPEKLVIEVRVSGEYKVIFWRKGLISSFIPGQMRPQEFPNYSETFVRGNTTADDEGFYIVQPQLKSGTSQTHPIIPTGGVDFGVIAPGNIGGREGLRLPVFVAYNIILYVNIAFNLVIYGFWRGDSEGLIKLTCVFFCLQLILVHYSGYIFR